MRLADRIRYLMERLLVRGVPYRLLLVALILVGIAVGGGVLAFAIGAFPTLGEAVWWAFLRLSDPGYLGDDEGAALRAIATLVTILGYVFFVGALVAVMTQWLNETIRDLERGLTPIADEDHLLVLGWTSRTPVIVEELLRAEERVKRFLARRGARRFRIVVLAEQVDLGLLDTLRTRAGDYWDEHRVVLRAGSPLVYDHLERAAFRRASAVILPGAAYPNASDDDTDERIIKTLALIGHYLRQNERATDPRREPPALVAEVFDKRSLGLAARVYAGDRRMVVSDAVSGQLVALALVQPGLAQVFTELLTFGAKNEIYIVEHAEVAGLAFGEVQARFPKAAVLGLVRPTTDGFRPLLAPTTDVRVEPGDRVAVIAEHLRDTEPAPRVAKPVALPLPREEHHRRAGPLSERRVLMLGWSHRAPAILEALAAMPEATQAGEALRIDVLAPDAVAYRERTVTRSGYDLSGLDLRHRLGDSTVAADLAPLDLGSYTNILVVATSQASGPASDARTIYAYVLLRDLLDEAGLTGNACPAVLIELTDEDNAVLYDDDPAEVILSPLMVSHMLAHVALRQELLPVYETLFRAGGPQLRFRSAAHYGLTGRPVGVDVLRQAAAQRGEAFLGVRLHADRARRSGLRLHPPRTFSATLTPADDLLVLATE